jgi:hypothetical protein
MAKAAEDLTPIDWPLLSDVLRYFVARDEKPEADIRSEILELMHSGKLPHLVDRTIRYFSRPAGASTSEPPPIEVVHNKPIPSEVLLFGVAGRGSLHIDWRNSRGTRRAGATWDRIELEGIRCSRERMLALAEPTAGVAVTDTPASLGSATSADTVTKPLSTRTAGQAATELLPMDPKDWLKATVPQWEISRGHGAITEFSKALEKQMAADYDAGKVTEVLKAKTIRNRLHDYKLWPIGQPHHNRNAR